MDAYGGDDAPLVVVKGVLEALSKEPSLAIQLTGPIDSLHAFLKDMPVESRSRIVCVDAPQVVDMGETPARAFKDKPQSSIRVGLGLLKQGAADAFVSAGNTGAVMMAATLDLGRISGIERPCIATIFPGKRNPFVMVDMGASVDSKPSHLMQFARLGLAYAKVALGISQPTLGLLNIGEETSKGDQRTQAVHVGLTQSELPFIGNVEGKQLFNGAADVVVADGFVGNVMLKFGEGVADLFFDFFKTEARGSLRTLLGLLLLAPFLKKFKARYDYREYGGAPLLGVNGVVVIAHGRSDATAICNAIMQAHRCVRGNLVSQLQSSLT